MYSPSLVPCRVDQRAWSRDLVLPWRLVTVGLSPGPDPKPETGIRPARGLLPTADRHGIDSPSASTHTHTNPTTTPHLYHPTDSDPPCLRLMAPIRTRSRQSSVSLSPISPLSTINPLNSPPHNLHSDLEPPPYSPPGRSHSTPSLSALGLDLSPWATGAHPALAHAPPAPPIQSRHSSASLASQHLEYSPPHSRQGSLAEHYPAYAHASGSGWADDDGDQLEFGRRQSSGRPIRRRTTNQPSNNMARARNVSSLPESEPPQPVRRISDPSSQSCMLR